MAEDTTTPEPEAVALPAILAAIDAVATQAEAMGARPAPHEAIDPHTLIPPEMEDEPMRPPLPAALPPEQPGEEIMTRAELGRSRKPWLKDAKYRIYTWEGNHTGHRTGWWGKDFSGYYQNRDVAGVCDYKKVMTLESVDYFYLYIEKPVEEVQGPVDPNAPKRTGNMVALVGPTVVKLLKVAPNNGTLRAKLMAALGEFPPKEADTFDKLKDWVEFNFPKSKSVPKSDHIADMVVTFTEHETGRCRYKREQRAAASVKIKPEDIANIMDGLDEEAEFDEVMSELENLVEERARENVNDYETVNEDHENYDANDIEREDYDYPLQTLKASVREYIRLNYPDAANEMGLE